MPKTLPLRAEPRQRRSQGNQDLQWPPIFLFSPQSDAICPNLDIAIAGFTRKTCRAVGILCERRGQHFHRHVTAEFAVVRAIHFSDSACTEGRDEEPGLVEGESSRPVSDVAFPVTGIHTA